MFKDIGLYRLKIFFYLPSSNLQESLSQIDIEIIKYNQQLKWKMKIAFIIF